MRFQGSVVAVDRASINGSVWNHSRPKPAVIKSSIACETIGKGQFAPTVKLRMSKLTRVERTIRGFVGTTAMHLAFLKLTAIKRTIRKDQFALSVIETLLEAAFVGITLYFKSALTISTISGATDDLGVRENRHRQEKADTE